MKIKNCLMTLIACSVLSTGLQARYYDAGEGRFLTPDRVVKNPYNPQTLNRYSYVENNPINYTDPSGNLSWDIKNTWRGIEKSVSHPWHQSGAASWWNKNRYYVGTAALVAATWGAASWAATGSTMQGIFSSAFIGEISGAVTGGIAANAAGGNIGKGMLFGSAVGGITNGLGEGLFPAAKLQHINGIDLVGARMAQGAINGFGYGASYGYAGGRGNGGQILRGGINGLAIGGFLGGALGSAEWYARSHNKNYFNLLSTTEKGPVVIDESLRYGGFQPVSLVSVTANKMNAVASIPILNPLTVNIVHNTVGTAATSLIADRHLRHLAWETIQDNGVSYTHRRRW